MKIKKCIKKTLSVMTMLWVFLNLPIKTHAAIFNENSLATKENILNVSFTTNPAAVNGSITICRGQTITYTNTSTNTGTNPTYL